VNGPVLMGWCRVADRAGELYQQERPEAARRGLSDAHQRVMRVTRATRGSGLGQRVQWGRWIHGRRYHGRTLDSVYLTRPDLEASLNDAAT
jgi:hypothetical protein